MTRIAVFGSTNGTSLQPIIDAIKNGNNLGGKDGALTPLIKQLTEAAMKAQLDEHLAQENSPDRKNGSTKK